MSCNTFLAQCSCEGSTIDLLAPSSGNYTLYFFLRFANKQRQFDVTVSEGDNFVLPFELNPFTIYELIIKQGNTTIEIDDVDKWYLESRVCEDNETSTVTTSPNSFVYILEDQTGATLDISGDEVDTDSGVITINEAIFDDYDMYVYKNGALQYQPFHYTLTESTQVLAFVIPLAEDTIILQFIKK